jgi:hypothetical protein
MTDFFDLAREICHRKVHVVDCGCGRQWSLAGFRELNLYGRVDTGIEGVWLELRDCACGSTRAIHVDGLGQYVDDDTVAALDEAAGNIF